MAPMEYSPNGKDIMTPMEYTPWFISSCFYETFFFEGVMVMVKDEKKYNIKYIYLLYLNLPVSIPVDDKIKIV